MDLLFKEKLKLLRVSKQEKLILQPEQLLYQQHLMNKLVQDKIKESKKSDAKVVPLKEALQAVYARPDADRMIEKVLTPLRMELQDLGEYERIINDLTDEALNALKHTKNFKPSVQVTYAIFLENLMADSRRLAETEDNLERKLLKKIKKGNVKITKEAANERRVRSLSEARSPSDIASDILDGIEKMEKEKIEAEKKAAEEAAKSK